jgi:hypothetical protein
MDWRGREWEGRETNHDTVVMEKEGEDDRDRRILLLDTEHAFKEGREGRKGARGATIHYQTPPFRCRGSSAL